MKNLYVLLIALLFFSFSNAQIVNIPDANFKDTLINTPCVDTDGDGYGDSDADINNDGEIQVSEAEAVLGLIIYKETSTPPSEKIESLEGIQSFINLTLLSCANNLLTSLNVSQNPNLIRLWCKNNQLTNIDISQNPNIQSLECSINLLTSLDVSQNPNLSNLYCHNNQLTDLDVSQNLNLYRIECDNNLLTNLDVSQNLNLERLFCSQNQITSLDVSTSITFLACSFNQITSLDLSEHLYLSSLFCGNNQLTSLNIRNGNNYNMEFMWAMNNDLDCIEVDDVPFAYSAFYWSKDFSTIYSEECILGLEEVLETQVSLYPNPVKDILTIDNTTTTEITSIKLYDVLGRLVMVVEDDYNQIDVSSLNSGAFFLNIETDRGVIAKKIIKE